MRLNEFMEQNGENFSILRNNEVVAVVDGMRNSSNGKKMIQFFPGTDIQPEDVVISELTSEEFYIDDVTTSRGFDQNEIFSKNAFYLTKVEYFRRNNQNPAITFNIGDVQNSIIGTQQQATLTNNFSDKQIIDMIDKNCGDDKELMLELLNTVNAILENNIPVQKGTFSRFSETSSKYGWLLGAVTQKLLTHFF